MKYYAVMCKILFLAIFFSMCLGCSDQIKSTSDSPVSDSVYANVFKPLDGTWEGKFLVYEDRRGQIDGGSMPKPISKPIFLTRNFEKILEVQVKQHYESKSPFYQKVNILDVYRGDDGSLDTIQSSGYNKVEDGKLKCVVNKPSEQVIHKGYLLNDTTIVWQRHLTNPLKVEYFQETVSKNQYKIIGWGYYGQDNLERTPKTWFYATYNRVLQ